MLRPIAAVVALTMVGLLGCADPPPPSGLGPVTDAEAAFEAAVRLAEIRGPYRELEISSGRYEDLDPESHNAPFDPGAAARWEVLADRRVWRVTFAGPDGSETAVIDAQTGELRGSVVQGH
jgi:hypothetical protein